MGFMSIDTFKNYCWYENLDLPFQQFNLHSKLFAASNVLYRQCCTVLSCIATPIMPHHIITFNKRMSSEDRLQPKTTVLNSEKCIIGITSSNLLAVQVSVLKVLKVLKNILPVYRHPIYLQLQYKQKRNVKFEEIVL